MGVPRLALLPNDDEAAVWACWEGQQGGRTFEAYPSHAELWRAVSAAPEPRCAYEIVRERAPCKLYADVELYTPFSVAKAEQEEEAQRMRVGLRVFLEAMRRAGGGGALTVLDGTRRAHLPADKAAKLLGTSPQATEAQSVWKRSYHVVVQGHAFENAAAVKARMQQSTPSLASCFPEGSALRALAERQPGAVDMSVYYKNKHFRMLDCCKANAPDAPFRFDAHLNEHTEPLDALVTYARHLPRMVVVGAPIKTAPAAASSSRGVKRPRTTSTASMMESPSGMLAGLQALMVRCGDSRTEVLGLHATEEDGTLRWECRNRGTRPCLLSQTDHRSNQALLFVSLPPSLVVPSSKVYDVKYQCMSERCGRPTGIIGRLRWCDAAQTFAPEVEFPPRLCPASRRPSTFRARTVPAGCFHEAAAAHPEEEAASEEEEEEHGEDDEEAAPPAAAPPLTLAVAAPHIADGEVDPEDPVQNTYERVKARFELRCFKVLSPFAYAHLIDDQTKEPDLYTPIALKHLYANLYYFERDAQQEWKKQLFVPKWMGDVRIKQVKRIVVDPVVADDGQNYNMWPGFAAERLPPVPDADVAELIEPIVRHLYDVYANTHAETTEFLLDYFANMVQRPDRPSHVALSLWGRSGVGKGMPLTFMREKVLGKAVTYQTANPENDLLGRFQNGCVNRVLVQVDEVRSLREHDDRLKDLITNDTVQLERKGRDIVTVRNLVNLVFTSNNENALTVGTDDRRFVLLRCSEKYKANGPYLCGLGRHMERPEVARAFFQFCMGRDLSRYTYDMQLHRPVTDYYLECQRSNVPVTSRFFSALIIAADCPEQIGALALFQRFMLFVNAGMYRVHHTETSFGRHVRRIAGVTKTRQARGTVYQLDAERIRRHLAENNELDEDASLL
jgi:hypothetical protein